MSPGENPDVGPNQCLHLPKGKVQSTYGLNGGMGQDAGLECAVFYRGGRGVYRSPMTGIRHSRNVAKGLVFLGNTPEATSRDIERGADLR